MKALVKYAKGPGNMEIRDIPEPTAGPGQVKIEIKATGICGSDLHIYHDDIAIPIQPPVVTGHEFSGIITEVGAGVTEWQVGERVVSETAYDFCGSCVYCITGFYNLCNQRKTLGYWYNGAFTQYTVVPAVKLHRLPEPIDFIGGALTEPLACVTHATLELTHITIGDLVLITGPGAVGLLAMQVARAHGARVIVAGTNQDAERLQRAAELGADDCLNVQQQNLVEEVQARSGGSGADVVFECSGNATALNDGLLAIKKQGQFTQIGLFGKPLTVDVDKVCFKEVKFTGSLGSRWTSWGKALQLMAQKKIQLNPLVSHTFPITEWQQAFTMFEEKQGLKLVLTPVPNRPE